MARADPPHAELAAAPAGKKNRGREVSAPVPACVPGAQAACACQGGSSGVQVCAEDGSRYEACQCVAPSPQPAAYALGPAPAQEQRESHRRSTALMVVGIVTAGVGAIVFGTGVAVFATAPRSQPYQSCYGTGSSQSCSTSYTKGPDDQHAAGGALMVGGGAGLVGGALMTIFGAVKVRSRPDIEGFSIAPTVGRETNGATLRFAF